LAPPSSGDGLVRDALARIEAKLDRIETETMTRFGNMELRIAMIEGNQINRKESVNRAWAGVFAFTLPTVGCFVWVFTTINQISNKQDTIDNFGTKFGRGIMESYETRFKTLEKLK